MFEVYFGNDEEKVSALVRERVASLQQAGTSVTTIDNDSFALGMLDELATSSSLFGTKLAYVLDIATAKEEFRAEVLELLEGLAASDHVFLLKEGTVLAPLKKKYQAHGEHIEECKKVAGARFNTFSLAEALAAKDKKRLWLLRNEATKQGSSAEELIGILWWQLKMLRLAASTGSASEAGVKDFPYNKAKRALPTFAAGELERLSQSLLQVYHDGHSGVQSIDEALEEWVLRL